MFAAWILLCSLLCAAVNGMKVNTPPGRTVYLRACSADKIVVPPIGSRMPANLTMQWILRAPRGRQIRLFFRELELRMIGHGGCKDALAIKNGYPPFEESSQVICGAWDNTEVLGEYRMTLRIHVGVGSIIPRDVGMHLEYSCVDREDQKATAPCPKMFPCSTSVKDYLRWTECQPLSAKCDGIDQCPNGEDERKCPGNAIFDPMSGGLGSECPSKTLFKCAPHSCIPRKWVCDGKKDCDNGADEKRSKCRERKTTTTTSAITTTAPPKRKRKRCSRRRFLCPTENVCIRKKFVCDGLKDCSNGEDEADCGTTVATTLAPKHNCKRKEFFCGHEGVCIDKRFVCDEFQDCSDGEDEKNCQKDKRTPQSKTEDQCGKKKFPPKGPWYWNLVLERRGRRLCSAVLIEDTIAITTAHCARPCVHDNSNCEVLLASRLRKKKPRAVLVTKTVLHPDFVRSEDKNDVAILKLEDSLGRKSRSICVDVGEDLDKANCYVAGFGNAKKNHLNQAKTSFLSAKTCRRTHSQKRKLTENQLCVSYSSRKLDICDEESGAPLSCFDKKKQRWFLAGISVREVRCNSARKFGVFQSLQNYMSWITATSKELNRS